MKCSNLLFVLQIVKHQINNILYVQLFFSQEPKVLGARTWRVL